MKDTKIKLLNAALEMFSKHGFEGTSTRALAEKAQVNLAAIAYYFGDKADLYNAVIASVLDKAKQSAEKKIKFFRELAGASQKTSSEALEMLHKLMENFVDLSCGNKISPQAVDLILREMVSPTEKCVAVYNEITTPLHKALTELISKITGFATESIQANVLTHSLMGQLMVFRTQKDDFLKRMGLKRYTPRFISQIKKMLVAQTDAILNLYTQGNSLCDL